MKHALLLIAHGSRRAAANQEFQQQVQALASQLAQPELLVKACYLELCPPGISQALAELAEQGVERIRILPCFLNQGRHVAEDVPADVAEFTGQFPKVEVEMLPYLGAQASYIDFLTQAVTSVQSSPKTGTEGIANDAAC